MRILITDDETSEVIDILDEPVDWELTKDKFGWNLTVAVPTVTAEKLKKVIEEAQGE